MRLSLCSALCGLAAYVSAARLTVSIPGTQFLPNPATLPSSTHAILLGPPGVRHDSLLRSDNTFLFDDLEATSYLLTVHTRDYSFPPIRVDVSKVNEQETIVSAWQTFRGNEWSHKGPELGSGKDGLTVDVQPNGVKDYYQKRQGFNALSFLKNPMILMGLVSVGLIFGLPYLMENLDPEMKAELEEMQKGSASSGTRTQAQEAADKLQNFDLAGWMAGGTKPSPAASSKKR